MIQNIYFNVVGIEDDDYHYVVLMDGVALVVNTYDSIESVVSKAQKSRAKMHGAQLLEKADYADATKPATTPSDLSVDLDDKMPF